MSEKPHSMPSRLLYPYQKHQLFSSSRSSPRAFLHPPRLRSPQHGHAQGSQGAPTRSGTLARHGRWEGRGGRLGLEPGWAWCGTGARGRAGMEIQCCSFAFESCFYQFQRILMSPFFFFSFPLTGVNEKHTPPFLLVLPTWPWALLLHLALEKVALDVQVRWHRTKKIY